MVIISRGYQLKSKVWGRKSQFVGGVLNMFFSNPTSRFKKMSYTSAGCLLHSPEGEQRAKEAVNSHQKYTKVFVLFQLFSESWTSLVPPPQLTATLSTLHCLIDLQHFFLLCYFRMKHLIDFGTFDFCCLSHSYIIRFSFINT